MGANFSLTPPMNRRALAVATLMIVAALPLSATTFVLPTDEELEAKTAAIVIGVVEGQWVEESDLSIDTIYEVRVSRTIKGTPVRDELIRLVSPGGVIDERGVIVPGAARFASGERVLLFLDREGGRWTPVDLTLGKFRFVTSMKGERLVLRDTDDAELLDRAGRPATDRPRREAEFLHFLEERAAGRRPPADYFASTTAAAFDATTDAGPDTVITNATFPPKTYTDNVSLNGTYLGTRWPSMASGVTFRKRVDQNIPGASDGGVAVIQNALAAWTNECGSVVNLVYGGTTTTASKTHDATNVVEYNDPQGRVGGSWTGSGTIAITFLSFAGTHTFSGETWWNITDADVVFQDGFTATNAAFPTAMTHEVGHGIGWRHSNAHYIRSTGADEACNSAVEECSNAAIMYYKAISSYGYTLQPWDINAARAVYPGGTCGGTCTPPVITTQPATTTINGGSSATLRVVASGTAPLSYQWYTGASGNTGSPIAGATGTSITVSPTSTTSYWVRVTNACGSASSATATVNVNGAPLPPPTASKFYVLTPCRLLDTRSTTPLQSGTTRTFTASGKCGVPAGATSISVNVTAVTPPSTGFLTLYAGTGSPPNTSTINFIAGKTLANNALVRLLTDQFSAYYNGAGYLDFLVDVNGYFR